MEENYDFLVVGGGIVGLATAMELCQKFPDKKTVVIEKEKKLGFHQSTHNSGVIHSGIYYKPGSMKAKTCTEGVKLIKAFCREHKIQMEETGKVIVATKEDELPRLENLYKRGVENGVPGLEIISPEKLKEIEPHTTGLRAIWVPSTAIVDYDGVCKKYGEIIQSTGEIRLEEKVIKIIPKDEYIVVRTTKDILKTKYLINCAGLYSDKVASMAGVRSGVKIIPFKGEYYKFISGKEYYTNGLIYPVPDPNFPFLGVHCTKMVDGGVEVGPNAVLSFKREGYKKFSFSLDDTLDTLTYGGFWKLACKYWKMGFGEMKRSVFKSLFVKDLARLLPEVKSSELTFYKIGVRAQAMKPNGDLVDDFWVESAHRMIHVLNAPSPAATASICIGRQIVDRCKEKFSL